MKGGVESAKSALERLQAELDIRGDKASREKRSKEVAKEIRMIGKLGNRHTRPSNSTC